VSATLVDIPNTGSILLDAGENTYGQMLRMMGKNEINNAINNLKAIFVSHLHADHHLGVVHILAKWFEVNMFGHTVSTSIVFDKPLFQLNQDNDEKIYVVSPWAFKLWLEEYSDVQDFGINKIVFINNDDVLYKREREARSYPK
jgi:ribonuclease Z